MFSLTLLTLVCYVLGNRHILDTPCMTDFVAVNLNSPRIIVNEIKYCYDKIPDFRTSVHGHNIKSDCYINEYLIGVNKSTNTVNRCGEWLEVVGPSQNPVMCMIAGSVDVTINGANPQIYTRIIGVRNSIFSQITIASGTSLPLSQVTVAESDFDLRINPSLYVLSKNDTHAIIQFTDHNRPPEKIEIIDGELNEEIKINSDDTFTIQLFSHSINIYLISFDSEKTEFKGIDLNTITRYATDDRFVSYNLRSCKYLADTQMFIEGKNYTNILPMFRWKMYYIADNDNVTSFPLTESIIQFDTPSDPISTCFLYSTPLRLNQDFKELRMDFRCSDLHSYKFIGANLYYTDRISSVDMKTANLISSDLPTKYYFDKDGETIHMKIGFDASSYQYSNFIKITHSVPIGTTLSLKKSYLIRSKANDNQTECDHTTFDCQFTECTITTTSSASPWQENCQPTCGTCRVGYVCSDQGFCLKEQNFNQRSGCLNLIISMFVLALLLVL
ncbi:hypothetical protein EDI_268380 [Entamoeba dispar SAW760]|uniref:Uncharacterized protein n=1 Tax=Entamoeba dispar (strain ATCC PRA-260 / SAW760) TaxID=370354 RepID=B0EGA9_ENTDS|nr:uncharacterized protein EDI_268380 [Entamoeba dispar SAW760]EDR26435.1 hypothetical protein EDI_268380 [Entamoeba dispar SAW760]|eukprot:EDR26435.1 hypothetical protein EDI_268380 [Entamoeba dispar SAW760]